MTAVIVISSAAAFLLLIFFLLASFITADMEYDGVFKYKIKYLCFTIIKNPLSPKEIKKKKRKEEKKKRKKEKKAAKEKAKQDKLSAKKRKERKKKSAAAQSLKTSEDLKAETESDPKDSAEVGSENDSDLKNKNNGNDSGGKAKKDKSSKAKVTPDLIFRILGKAKPHIKRIFKKIRISGVCVDITVGGDDAAKAAISYGAHCAAIDGLTAFLDGTVSFKAERISIRANFDLEKSVYYGKGRIKLRLSTLLHSGIWGALAVMGELKEVSELTEEDKKSPQKAA